MDSQTLGALEAALLASPDNHKLLIVLLREYEGIGDREALGRLFDRAKSVPLEAAPDRVIVARARWKTGDAEAALQILKGEDADELLLRARILATLDRRDEAARAYRRAVEINPTLEDLDLEALLKARVREHSAEGKPRLTVISNDNTDQTEMARLLVPNSDRITFSDVGGLDDLKKRSTDASSCRSKSLRFFQRFKKRVGGGILLYGPPGCGKTLLARATAGECDAKFLNVALSDILDMYIGESERKLHAIFDKARSATPSVIFFDELEALAAKRQFSREATS